MNRENPAKGGRFYRDRKTGALAVKPSAPKPQAESTAKPTEKGK